MLELLDKIDKRKLYLAIGGEKVQALEALIGSKLVAGEKKDTNLSAYILSIYGPDLLYETKIRRLFFSLIDPDKLKKFAEKNAKKSFDKPLDNALTLSLCPWKKSSELVQKFAEELNIPFEYLPIATNYNQTTEIIEPIDRFFPLHDYQVNLKDRILDELATNTRRMLIQMPTGSGKTRTVIEALQEYIQKNNTFEEQKSIIWVAHTEELCEQAIDTFKDVWQNLADFPTHIVRCWGNYNPTSFDTMGGFIVCTFQKLYSLMKNEADIYDRLKTVLQILVVDEAHKVIAPSYSEAISDLCSADCSSLIGITATPGRGTEKTEENRALADFFDKNLISPSFAGNPISELRDNKVLAHVNRRVINTNVEVPIDVDDLDKIKSDFELTKSIIRNLSLNVKRNKIIIKVIRDELEKKNPCLVFSCSVDHSRLLSAALSYYGYNSSYIDCKMRKGSRKRVVEGFRSGKYDVLFNYGVLSTGFDAPRIRTIIITRPTTSIILHSQMVGRGLRGPLMGGGEYCNLIDIKDNFLNFGGVEDVYSFFDDYWEK